MWINDNFGTLLLHFLSLVAASVSPGIEIFSVVFSAVGSYTNLHFQPS